MLRALYRRAALAGSRLAVASLSPCAAPPLAAQATIIALQGTVTGSDGSAPQGTQLDVRSREIGAARAARADLRGAYRVFGLEPGVYDIAVRVVGYRQQRREGVWLWSAGTRRSTSRSSAARWSWSRR
jgi:carboxypeptidase family protein